VSDGTPLEFHRWRHAAQDARQRLWRAGERLRAVRGGIAADAGRTMEMRALALAQADLNVVEDILESVFANAWRKDDGD